jgi:hypothetical protein
MRRIDLWLVVAFLAVAIAWNGLGREKPSSGQAFTDFPVERPDDARIRCDGRASCAQMSASALTCRA